MKLTQYFIFISLLSQLSFAQNFIIENKKANWQKVYTEGVTADEANLFLTKQNIDNHVDGTLVKFTHRFNAEDLKNFGYSWGSYPTYIQGNCVAYGFAEFKDNKYRVTITEIEVQNALDPALYFSISDYIVKRGKFRTASHHQKVTKTLDGYFTNLFSYKKSDW